MGSKGKALTLPSYDEIPLAEHSQTLKWVLAVCQGQQERLVLLEETVAQLKDEIAILKGEKPRPQIKPSTLNKDTARRHRAQPGAPASGARGRPGQAGEKTGDPRDPHPAARADSGGGGLQRL